jgi:hypothetical protein
VIQEVNLGAVELGIRFARDPQVLVEGDPGSLDQLGLDVAAEKLKRCR